MPNDSGRKKCVEWDEVEPGDDNKVTCKYCGIGISKKIARVRGHLQKCNKRKSDRHNPSSSDDSDVIPSKNTKTDSGIIPGGSVSGSANATKSKQPIIKHFGVLTSAKKKTEIDQKIAKFFYATNTAFNAASNKTFSDMIEALRPGYTPPNRQALGTTLLDDVHKELAETFNENLKKQVFDYDFVLMQDGWSSTNNDPILANSVYTGKNKNHILVVSVYFNLNFSFFILLKARLHFSSTLLIVVQTKKPQNTALKSLLSV